VWSVATRHVHYLYLCTTSRYVCLCSCPLPQCNIFLLLCAFALVLCRSVPSSCYSGLPFPLFSHTSFCGHEIKPPAPPLGFSLPKGSLGEVKKGGRRKSRKGGGQEGWGGLLWKIMNMGWTSTLLPSMAGFLPQHEVGGCARGGDSGNHCFDAVPFRHRHAHTTTDRSSHVVLFPQDDEFIWHMWPPSSLCTKMSTVPPPPPLVVTGLLCSTRPFTFSSRRTPQDVKVVKSVPPHPRCLSMPCEEASLGYRQGAPGSASTSKPSQTARM